MKYAAVFPHHVSFLAEFSTIDMVLILPSSISAITKAELLPNRGLTWEFKSYPVDATATFISASPLYLNFTNIHLFKQVL